MMPLAQMAEAVLRTADGREKTALSHKYAALWRAARADGLHPAIGTANPPDHPARPAPPELLSPVIMMTGSKPPTKNPNIST